MKKLVTVLTTSLLVFTFLAGTAVAAPAPKQDYSGGNNNGGGGISFWANGATSVTFENKGDSHTFYMTVQNHGDYDIQVTISTLVGGIDGYFLYTLPDGNHIVGPYATKTLSLWVEANGQSVDTPVSVSFTVRATSGYNFGGSLTFTATTLPGDGGPPDDSDSQPSQKIEPRHTSGNLVLY